MAGPGAAPGGEAAAAAQETPAGVGAFEPQDLWRLTIILSILLLLMYTISGHYIEKFKILVLHESTVGVLAGLLIQYMMIDHVTFEFSSESFFFYLLPPIVFASAYTLQKKNFIRNIAYVMGLGVLGTIVAMVVISTILIWGNQHFRDADGNKWVDQAECLLLASVLASTDTVAVLTLITADKYKVMNSILFGEGVVNDAVTILLYQAVSKQVMAIEADAGHGGGDHAHDAKSHDVLIGQKDILQMFGNFFSLSSQSIAMGIFIGLLCSYLLKNINMDYDSIKQTTFIMLFAYLAYLCAEQSKLSGIISMFVSGLALAHYAYWNINKKAKLGTEIAVNSIASICQSFLYIYLGLSAFTIKKENVKMDMVYVTLGAVLICRVFSVAVPIFLCWLASGCQPLKLKWNEWIFVYFGGLIRGAVCFGLALTISSKHKEVLITTTQICALVLIVGVGSPIQLTAYLCGVKQDSEKEAGDDFKKAEGEIDCISQDSQFSAAGAKNEDDVVGMIDHSFDDLITEGTYPTLLQKWLDFDKTYMMPIFKRKTELSGEGLGSLRASMRQDKKFGQ